MTINKPLGPKGIWATSQRRSGRVTWLGGVWDVERDAAAVYAYGEPQRYIRADTAEAEKQAAVQAERERCAKLVDAVDWGFTSDGNDGFREIEAGALDNLAAAIRKGADQ